MMNLKIARWIYELLMTNCPRRYLLKYSFILSRTYRNIMFLIFT